MRRSLLLSVALLVVSLGAAATADAAVSSKRCEALAAKAKMKVIVKGKTSLVARRGTLAGFTLRYRACLYRKPRLYLLPDQNGETERYDRFTLAGDFLAYAHTNVEEASTTYPTWIELVDLSRRKRLFQHDAFGEVEDGDLPGIPQILLRDDGAVAWIGRKTEGEDLFSVQTILPGQRNPAEVDRGSGIGAKSLRRSEQSRDVFSWTRDGVRKEAAFGGPTVTP